MSKFNTVATIKTTNAEGFPAYDMDPKSKLVTQVLTSFFNENKFYGDNSEEIVETIKTVIKTDPEFISKLAMFARREFNMRSVSHVLVGYLAHEPEGKPFVKETVKRIILRGDDATEILSFYLNTFGKPIPNSLRKALRDIFGTFDAYTLAKYKGEGKGVKMRDILCLCHPSPISEEQSKLWKQLLEGTIQPAYTWETELSVKGNKKETWEELIASGRLPYMAMLRNLRNIINAEPSNINDVVKSISNPELVRKSRQLPFRYLSAYKNLPGSGFLKWAFLDALEDAAEASIANLPKIPGRTVIAIDTSGSMCDTISARSDVRCYEIAILLGMIANKLCEHAIVYSFDDDIHELRVPKRNGLLFNTVHEHVYGGGTNMGLPFLRMTEDKISCDRMIIISDNQCNSYSYWFSGGTVQQLADKYRKYTGNDIWVHAIDLQGYGTQQFCGPKTNIIAGWSEKLFEFILLAEKGHETLVNRIANYRPVYWE